MSAVITEAMKAMRTEPARAVTLLRSALQQDLSFNAVAGWEVGRNLRAGMARDAPCQVVASAPRGGVRPPDWWPVAFAGVALYLRRSRSAK